MLEKIRDYYLENVKHRFEENPVRERLLCGVLGVYSEAAEYGMTTEVKLDEKLSELGDICFYLSLVVGASEEMGLSSFSSKFLSDEILQEAFPKDDEWNQFHVGLLLQNVRKGMLEKCETSFLKISEEVASTVSAIFYFFCREYYYLMGEEITPTQILAMGIENNRRKTRGRDEKKSTP